jgi:hypothetical protein
MSVAPALYREAVRVRSEALRRHEPIYVYLIQQGTHGPVKIGLAKNPQKRLATLQQANPTKLHGIAAWRGLPFEEAMLHEEFADQRIRGEWFKPTPEILRLAIDYGNEFPAWDSAEWAAA